MNGMEMKISEYESLLQAIAQTKLGKRNYHRVYTICSYLSKEQDQKKISQVFSFLDYQMELYRLDQLAYKNNTKTIYHEGA
jgi:hypothetical protein